MALAFQVRILALLLAATSAQAYSGLPQESPQQSSSPSQTNQSQTSRQTSSSGDHAKSTAVPPPKPCSVSPESTSVKPANCTSEVSHKRKRQPPPPPPDNFEPGEPTKTVVRNGGTGDAKVAISPGMSDQQASQKLQHTNQLLTSTDADLKQIAPRQLNASQQDTVKQIKSFVDQAKVAVSKGDVERAYNLASKANMLSADLVRPR
jgi:hypothetical protein